MFDDTANDVSNTTSHLPLPHVEKNSRIRNNVSLSGHSLQVGYYLKNCGGGTNAGKCEQCIHSHGAYFSSTGKANDPKSCALTACAPCPTGYYRADCGGVSKGRCERCSNLPSIDHYYTEHSGTLLSNNCPTKACSAEAVGCTVGTYLKGCGGHVNGHKGMARGECAPCPGQSGHASSSESRAEGWAYWDALVCRRNLCSVNILNICRPTVRALLQQKREVEAGHVWAIAVHER